MIIKRDKKEKTEEEKELDSYKRGRNVGLAALGTGAGLAALSRIGKNTKRKDGSPIQLNNPDSDHYIDPVKARKLALWSGVGIGALGLGLHGISAVKYNKLKKKLKKEKEEEKTDDNTEKKD